MMQRSRGFRGIRVWFCIWFCLCFGLTQAFSARPAGAAEADLGQDAIVLTVKRGLTAQLTFSNLSGTLRAIPDQSMDAAVLVRLERADQSAKANLANRTGPMDHKHTYTLWFFGTVAGDYDLSQWVVQKDGSALSKSDALPAMKVRVVSELPPGHGTSLYEIDDPTLRAPGGYRAALILFALLWTVGPLVWTVVRLRARRPLPPVPIVPPATLSDRLRPLLERASQGLLTVDEQSRLEMLLYVFWQQRLGLPDSMAEALPVLRRHAEAGGLLRALEAWIHADHASRPSLSATTMDALLVPYHAVQERELNATQGSVSGGTA